MSIPPDIQSLLDAKEFPSAWEKIWDARVAALERHFGPVGSSVYHGEPPIWEEGGTADVVWFQPAPDRFVYVTADLTGPVFDAQVPAYFGRYELAIVTREPNDWAPSLLGVLSAYTLMAALEPGNTADIGNFLRSRFPRSRMKVVYCCQPEALPKEFEFMGATYGLITVVGLTPQEFSLRRKLGVDALEGALTAAGVLPYTDPARPPVSLPDAPRRRWFGRR